jgi:arylsulfatase A-like enzyme
MNHSNKPMKTLILLLSPILFISCDLKQPDRAPNVLWIVVEDMSPHFGYNGETLITTPHVDQMAAEGVVFERAYVSAPVCSTSRSALITGMNQTSIGVHNHRSSKAVEIHLPEGMKTVPEYFKEAGYHTSNQRLRDLDRWRNPGKEDYNFVYSTEQLYDGIDWKERDKGQPFFAQIQLGGGKSRNAKPPTLVDPDQVVLPPHYPDDPVLREDWAAYLNSVKQVDLQVEKIFSRLREEGLLETTVVFFFTDHGISHARAKQFCYEEGSHIPLIIWGERFVGKGTRTELVSHIDIAATSLALAGIPVPPGMEARPLFGDDAVPRDYVITARDRCDETVDRIRSVRKGDFLYIKNYLHQRPLLQPNAYKDFKSFMKRLRKLHETGQLSPLQERILFAKERPAEELYHLAADPNQYENLAADPKFKEQLEDMRTILSDWEERTGDQGRTLESYETYASEIEPFVARLEGPRNRPDRARAMRNNMALMKQWASEGK